MNLNKKLSMPAPLLIDAVQKNVSFSLFLGMTAIFFGCASPILTSSQTNVSIKDDRWLINEQPVHDGSPAEGLLMNVRMVNTVFEDTSSNGKDNLAADFDPEENTTRL